MHAIWARRFAKIASSTSILLMLGLASLTACGDDGLTEAPQENPFDDNDPTYDGTTTGTDASTNTGADVPVVEQPDGKTKPDTTTVPDPDTSVQPTGPYVLEFVEDTGDDGVACKGEDTCSLTLFFNGSRKVRVRYLQDGAPLKDGLVTFDLVGADAQSALSVNPTAAYADGDGVAETTVDVANNTAGTFEVRVTAGDEHKPQPISYFITVESKVGPPLTITFNPMYDKTKTKFSKIETLLFKHTENKAYECTDPKLDPVDPPDSGIYSATLGPAPVSKVEESVVVPALPGLEKDLHQKYTVIAMGKTSGDPALIKVVGCNDADGNVEFGQPRIVTVDLYPVPPNYEGTFEVTTYLDLTSALPPNIKNIFDILFGLFESPTGGIMKLACTLGGGALDSICGYVFADPDNPVIGEWAEPFGSIIVQIVDGIIVGLIESTELGKSIFYTGKDLGQLLQHLELHSFITISPIEPKKKAFPDKDGFFTADQCSQEWTDITVKWSLNAGCDPSEPGCGQKNFNFNVLDDTNKIVSAKFEAQVTPTYYDLNIFTHSVNFKYGALLNAIIKQMLLPAVFGDGSDGYAPVDSYEGAIGSLLCGKENNWDMATCCAAFADKIASGGAGAIKGTVEMGCTMLIPLGAGYLEGMLTGLDLDVDNMKMQTAQACKLYDEDKKGKVDGRISRFGTAEDPCHWTIDLELFGFKASFDAEFFALPYSVKYGD